LHESSLSIVERFRAAPTGLWCFDTRFPRAIVCRPSGAGVVRLHGWLSGAGVVRLRGRLPKVSLSRVSFPVGRQRRWGTNKKRDSRSVAPTGLWHFYAGFPRAALRLPWAIVCGPSGAWGTRLREHPRCDGICDLRSGPRAQGSTSM
jgi:hypothetical protein